MTNPAILYEQAASCFERAGHVARAASCLEAAGLPAAAAEQFEEAGDLAAAARCYRAARLPARAEHCYLAIGEPEQAAAAWEETGDLVQAALVLALRSRRFEHARWLAAEAMPSPPGPGQAELHELRLRAIIALCDARATGDSSSLAQVLLAIEEAIPSLPPNDRVRCESFCQQAAHAIGRYDLAARVMAASSRAGTPGAGARWRAWAERVLGSAAGIPASATVATDLGSTSAKPAGDR